MTGFCQNPECPLSSRPAPHDAAVLHIMVSSVSAMWKPGAETQKLEVVSMGRIKFKCYGHEFWLCDECAAVPDFTLSTAKALGYV